MLQARRADLCTQQALYSAIQEVAQKFPQNLRARYVEAAKNVRLPYFDWAVRVRAGADSLPPSIARQTISVVDTDGRRKSVENPLYSFKISQVRPDRGDLTRGVCHFTYKPTHSSIPTLISRHALTLRSGRTDRRPSATRTLAAPHVTPSSSRSSTTSRPRSARKSRSSSSPTPTSTTSPTAHGAAARGPRARSPASRACTTISTGARVAAAATCHRSTSRPWTPSSGCITATSTASGPSGRTSTRTSL